MAASPGSLYGFGAHAREQETVVSVHSGAWPRMACMLAALRRGARQEDAAHGSATDLQRYVHPLQFQYDNASGAAATRRSAHSMPLEQRHEARKQIRRVGAGRNDVGFDMEHDNVVPGAAHLGLRTVVHARQERRRSAYTPSK